MAILVDASSPAVVNNPGSGSPAATASFSPPANSVLLVMANAGWSAGGTVTMAISDSGGHTWMSPVKAAGTFSNGDGGVSQIFYTYLATAPGSITVSLAYSGFGTGGGGEQLDLLVLTGCNPDQSKGATASSPTQSGTNGTLSIITTATASLVFGASSEVTTSSDTWTANSSTRNDNTYTDTTNSVVLVGWAAQSATTVPGAITLGGTWSSTAEHNDCAFEVLPAPGIYLVQGLLSGASKTTATSYSITGSNTVSHGNTLYFAATLRVSLAYTATVTDNLGNTYTQLGSNGGSAGCWSSLFRAPVTAAGTLTTITISITTGSSGSAFAGTSAEFSGDGAINNTGLASGTGTNLNAYPGGSTTATAAQVSSDMWIGGFSWQAALGTVTIPVPSTAGVAASQPLPAVGTTGNPTSTNASCTLAYFICNAATSNMLNAQISSSVLFGAAGADIAPTPVAVAVAAYRSLILPQAVRRSTLY